MKKFFILIICTLCFVNYTTAQNAMGSWRTHISYTNISQITQSNEKIYGISAGSLFSVNKNDNIIETYSKIYGLLANHLAVEDITELKINNSNSNISISDDKIINISEINLSEVV